MKMLRAAVLNILLIALPVTGKPYLNALLESISADSMRKHVCFLGDDSLQGRGTGTFGEALAADYVAAKFDSFGLEAIGDNQTYFQRVPMHGSKPLPGSRLVSINNGDSIEYELKRDYLLYQSGAQTYIPMPVPVVFVGYGIIAPEFDYNDYQALDVSGKIVVFLSGEPHSEDAAYFNGTHPTIYAYPEAKQRIAISRGAKGSIMIPAPREECGRNWKYWVNTFAFEDVTLAYAVTANLSMVMNPNAAKKLFIDAPFSLADVFRMDANNTIRSFPLNVQMSFRGKFFQHDFYSANVIGKLGGRFRESNESFIIISAHYDHLGVGAAVKGDSIYNGVFDNAVGVAAMLEIARSYARLAERPRRSIIFLATTGEEKGLLGAEYYVDHPVVPLHKTLANINVDGLSMFDRFKDVVGVGSEYSTLGKLLVDVTGRLDIDVSAIPGQFLATESYARSDQIAFAKAGIPSILIAEGLRYENSSPEAALSRIIDWQTRIYHSPFDDLNQPMDFEAARQHCQIICAFCYELANSNFHPEWNPGTPFINERLRSIAERR